MSCNRAGPPANSTAHRGHLLAGVVVLVAAVVLKGHISGPGTTSAGLQYADKFVPLALARHGGPFATARALPSATPTRTSTPPPTNTPTATITPGPSPTPTPLGGPIRYPTDPQTTILQIGWTDTDQPGLTWEEMNGTPYFTLYGDGRLIAGHMLFDWQQRLYEGQVESAQIQEWLRRLTYDIRFFTLGERYEHPQASKFAIHIYIRYGGATRDFKRVSIYGFTRWLRDPLPDDPDSPILRQVALFVKELEALATTTLDREYRPAEYTILSMEVNPYLPSPPAWTHPLDIVAISDSAPLRYGSDFVHGPPGHLVVGAAEGWELWQIITADARRDWPGLNQAAEYSVGRRRFVVGARQEVPGESWFLPPAIRMEWYRRDGGDGGLHGTGVLPASEPVGAGGVRMQVQPAAP